MQTASAELTAAILAAERRPVYRLFVDWDRDGFGAAGSIDDLTADVSSITTDRSLSTDLPDEVKLFEGYSVANATVTLARQPSTPSPSVTTVPYGAPIAYGDANYTYAGTGPPTASAAPLQHTTWYYSPYNTQSPLFGKKRKGAPARIDLGFVGTNGPEYLTVFTGHVRSLQVNAGSRDVSLVLEDPSQTMRRQVSLPMVIADGETAATTLCPGLNTTFLADWVARSSGYYSSPPPRTGCLLSATMHGSGWPEVGTLTQFHGANNTMLAFSPTAQFSKTAPWVMAVNTNGTDRQLITYIYGSGTEVSTNNGDALLFQCWVRFNAISSGTPHGQSIMQAYRTPLAEPFVALWVDSTGTLQCSLNRAGADNTIRGTPGPSGFVANTWYYVAAYWAFTSTGVKVWFRKDGTTTGPSTITTPSVTGAPFLNTLHVGRSTAGSNAESYLNGLIADVQLTSENTGSTTPPSWDDGFVPTATIFPDEANLVATPVTSDEAWTIEQQIAQSVFATAGFNETGTLQYLTRKRWSQAPWNSVQRTLDAATAIKDLSSTESIDQVRNRVVVRAKAPSVAGFGQIWVATTRYQIAPGGTKTVWMELGDPCANIDTRFDYGVDGSLGSRYLAGTERDGSGAQISNLTFTVSVLSPHSVKVVIGNPNSQTVWLTADASTPGLLANQAGSPYLILAGQRLRFDPSTSSSDPFPGANIVRSEASDATSIASFGEQLLEIGDSDFRQDADEIDRMAGDLLAQTKDPKPILTDIPIVGDPRLQLGDRVTLTDPDGLAVATDVHLSAIHTELGGGPDGRLDMTINVRPA